MSVVVVSALVSVDSVLMRFSSLISHTELEVSTESVSDIKNVWVNWVLSGLHLRVVNFETLQPIVKQH